MESAKAAELVFERGHTYYSWASTPIADATLGRIYDLAKLGPTSANCSPLRVAFIRSAEGKELLRPALSKSNLQKAMSAPVVAVLATDTHYLDKVPELYPAPYDARSWFTQTPTSAEENGIANTYLQAGYFILAARTLGLDCGPMSGFDRHIVDRAFFPNGAWRSRLLVNLGQGVDPEPYQRRPRLGVADACRFL